MNKVIIRTIFFSILAVLFILQLVQRFTFITASEMEFSYSRSINSWGETWRRCFVYGDTLYYMNDTNALNDIRTIKYSAKGVVHNLIKLSYPDEKFLIIDEKNVIVREEGTIYLLHTAKNSRVKLCVGEIIGFCNNRLYHVNNATLFEMDIIQRIEKPIVVFDTLLAAYYDGIIYEKDGAIYSFLLDTPLTPLLLTSKKIEWSDAGGWHEEFLYTADRIIRITTESIDVYSLNTGNIERIFSPELDRGILQMAATIHGDILYVSIQRTDIKNWPIKDKDINGIYRYDFGTEEWTKVSSKTYGTIMQFDAKNLYGINEYGLMNVGDVERIPLG